MKKYWYSVIPTLVMLLVYACSSDNGGDTPTDPTDDDGMEPTFSRADMLTNWTDNIIIPAYTAFLEDTETLQTEATAFSTAPTVDALNALRTAYVEAYKSWQHIDMFEIGPAELTGLRLNMNTYPTSITKIETNIADPDANFALPSNRDSKGFPALDYLFYGIADTDENIVAVYTDVTSGAAHLAYIQKIIADIDDSVTAVANEWTSTFRDSFVAEDGTGASASVDRLANDFLIYYEKSLRTAKIQAPLGILSGVQSPQIIESLYNPSLSNELFLEGLSATKSFFNGNAYGTGTAGIGFDDYLTFVESTIGGDINAQLDSAENAVSGLDSFAVELQQSPATDMIAAYAEVQDVVALLKRDMFSALSIAIDFQDQDND